MLPVFFAQQWPSFNQGKFAEVRLATKLQGAWSFLGGLFWEDINDEAFFYPSWEGSAATNFFAPGQTGSLGYAATYRNLKQEAAFGEVSWKFLPRWTLTGGARYYDYKRQENTTTVGPWYGDAPAMLIETDATGISKRANLSFKPTGDSLIYAEYSQGFRLGRPQNALNAGCDPNGTGVVPGTNITIASTKFVKSDSVDNYEIGTKLTMLDHRLSIAADVFRIDWVNVPFLVDVRNLGATVGPASGCYPFYTTNAGSARSEGIELQANYYITRAFRIDAGGSSIDPKLTQGVPALDAPSGTRLPASPKLNLNLALQYEFNLSGHKAFVRADSIYIGSFDTSLGAPVALSGGYTKVDLTANMAFQSFDVQLFARNVTNRDHFTYGGAALAGGTWALGAIACVRELLACSSVITSSLDNRRNAVSDNLAASFSPA